MEHTIRINLLKDALEKENKTLDDLAKHFNISKQSLYYRLNGRVLFKINELQDLKDFLNLDFDSFCKIFFK